MMKKIVVISFLLIYFISLAHSQSGEQGHFVKRIEYNLQMRNGNYNLAGKGDMEKLFFGDVNAPVEFSFLPSSESAFRSPPSGFRIVKGASNTSDILEVKYISNYEEAQNEASKKFPSIGVSNPSHITDALRSQIIEHNRDAFAKQYEEMFKLFKIEILTFPIDNQLVDRLYKKIYSFIDNFKAKGSPLLIGDGYSVVFRCVVEDEVWSLNIHIPQGDALKMADLCIQIITDTKAKKLNEQKYISVLNTFESR